MNKRARILWHSPHLLTQTDRRALLLGVVPPPPAVDAWATSIQAQWSDAAMTALTPERPAPLREVDATERLSGGSATRRRPPAEMPIQDYPLGYPQAKIETNQRLLSEWTSAT